MEALGVCPFKLMRSCGLFTIWLLGMLLVASPGMAQDSRPMSVTLAGDALAQSPVVPVSLIDLVHEAEQNNPEIAAAAHGYTASTQVARQVSALPETQVTVQQLSVGSPLPFAGYTNSEFAYIGLGVSQEIPYPGKRALRAQVANREADVHRVEIECVRQAVLEKLKASYFRL